MIVSGNLFIGVWRACNWRLNTIIIVDGFCESDTRCHEMPVRLRPIIHHRGRRIGQFCRRFTLLHRCAYVMNSGSDSVSVIDTTTNTVTATVPVEDSPVWAALTPNGRFAYVVNHGSGSVSVINTATKAVIAIIPVETHPYGVAVTP